MINDQHNHEATFADFHFAQRKIALIKKIRDDISRQLQIQTKSAQILSSLRISDRVASSDLENLENSIITSLFKSRDIHNLKAKLRRESLKFLTSVQILIRKLKQVD